MLGVWDYTVILTYMSVLSAGLGILVTLQGDGHPYLGMFFLMFCGLCDAFDGKVARSKKNRTEMEQKFGIQIDSLSDLVAFGVLPACIGQAMIRVCPTIQETVRPIQSRMQVISVLAIWLVILLYILAALVRLAYFNVAEEERQAKEGGVRKYYEGLPVTTAALIFPSVMLLQFVTVRDITALFIVVMCITGCLFVSKIRIPKPGVKGIMYMILFGIAEFLLLGITRLVL